MDGRDIPDWFDPPDDEVALFYTAPHAFDIAAQLSRRLLGCGPEWLIALPPKFLQREVRQVTLSAAVQLPGRSFVKHAVSKAFPSAVHDRASLAEAAAAVSPESLVHVAEPVTWIIEYRCFVRRGEVATLSPYRRWGQIIEDHSSRLGAPPDEIDAARRFCLSVVQTPSVACPPGVVIDVGIIEDRGWAVVESNECWASGIYACDPAEVLTTLLAACVPAAQVQGDPRWHFQGHYLRACR